ncbi:MAG: leucine-rich repeat protein, partial [Bacteroidota bacterium]
MYPIKYKVIALLFLIALCTNILFAQCPVNYNISIVGTHGVQDSINHFVSNYPNCNRLQNLILDQPIWPGVQSLSELSNVDSILGDLVLVGLWLNDFSGLENLKYVGGDIRIQQSRFNFAELTGFASLEFVGGDVIYTQNLTTNALNGFQNLHQIDGDLVIKDNNGALPTIGLENLAGFEQLESIGGSFTVSNHSNLDSIGHFSNLTSIGGQWLVKDNDNLVAIDTFNQLESVGDSLLISNNPLLSVAKSIPSLKHVDGAMILSTADTSLSFDQLETVQTLMIHHSDQLTSLQTFDQLSLIDGDLTITENENLTNLVGFNKLLEVKGSIQVKDNDLDTLRCFQNLANVDSTIYVAEILNDFQGLDNLTQVGGDLKIRFARVIPHMNALQTVGKDLDIQSTIVSSLDHFNTLTTIGGTLLIADYLDTLKGFDSLVDVQSFPLAGFDDIQFWGGFGSLQAYNGDFVLGGKSELDSINAFKALQTVYGDFVIENNHQLRNLSNFVQLKTVNGFFRITHNDQLQHISGFDALEDIIVSTSDAGPAAFEITYHDQLKTIRSFNGMEHLDGEIRVDNNLKLDSIIGFNGLKTVEFYYNPGIFQFSNFKYLDGFNNVDTIRSNWIISGYDIQVLHGFQNLKHVDGYINVLACLELRELTGFNQLETLERFSIFSCPKLKQYDGLHALRSTHLLSFQHCDSLELLNGMEQLDSVGLLAMRNLPRLTSLPLFEEVDTIETLFIERLDSMKNFTTLPNVKKIRDLYIWENGQLNAVNGFDQLAHLDNFEVEFNWRLKSLPPFPNLQGQLSTLELLYNPALPEFSGFNQLQEIDHWKVKFNDSLQLISGFNALELITGDMEFSQNTRLTQINGFHQLDDINGTVRLFSHPDLSLCSVPFLCKHVANGGLIQFFENGTGCNSAIEIAQACDQFASIK